MMDDMGYGDMGCYGNPLIETPVMDSIAENGIRFTSMYSAPLCTPARAQLLTGRYASKIGLERVLFPQDEIGLKNDYRTIPAYLKPHGYESACIGKWHLGCKEEHYPTRHGFDYFYGLLYSNDMSPLHLYRNEEALQEEVNQAELTERYTREAISFIERSKDKPFFCYIAHTMPHIPLFVPEAFRGKSKCGTYGDTIACIDHYIGVLRDYLESNGLLDNTLIIATSDNGPWFEGSTAGLRGRKFSVYEGGARMPFVAMWKGVIPAGEVCDEPAHFIDMLPTFVELAGGNTEVAEGIDGLSIADLFRGGGASPHDILYFFSHRMLNAARAGKWKLHVAEGEGRNRSFKEYPRLYDLELDPSENYNLADRYPDIVADLEMRIEQYQQLCDEIGQK
jgi:uncharacterized sulfatase